jgi:hypothetical protein
MVAILRVCCDEKDKPVTLIEEIHNLLVIPSHELHDAHQMKVRIMKLMPRSKGIMRRKLQ